MKKRLLLLFLVITLYANAQEALRIFDIPKKSVTYNLKDLDQLGTPLEKRKETISQFKKNEEERTQLSPIYTVDFTIDSRFILSGGTDGIVKIWNVSTGAIIKKIKCHEGRVLAAKFFNGTSFFSISDDGKIKYVNGSNGSITREFRQEESIASVVSMENIPTTIAPTEQQIKDIPKRKEITGKATVGFENSLIYNTCLDFSKNKKFLVVGASDALLTIYDINNSNSIKFLRGHKKQINCVAFLPLKNYILSGSDDNNIILWKWDKDESKILTGHTGPVLSISVSNNSNIFASGSADNNIKVWNIIKGQATQTLEGHEGSVTALVMTKNNKYVVSGSLDNSIRIWDARRGNLIKVYQMSDYPVTSIALSQNENFIIAGAKCVGRAIRLFQFKSIIQEYEKSLN